MSLLLLHTNPKIDWWETFLPWRQFHHGFKHSCIPRKSDSWSNHLDQLYQLWRPFNQTSVKQQDQTRTKQTSQWQWAPYVWRCSKALARPFLVWQRKRCQAGALVHLGAVLQALAAIGQCPEWWRHDLHLQDALECLHPGGQDALQPGNWKRGSICLGGGSAHLADQARLVCLVAPEKASVWLLGGWNLGVKPTAASSIIPKHDYRRHWLNVAPCEFSVQLECCSSCAFSVSFSLMIWTWGAWLTMWVRQWLKQVWLWWIS